MLHGSDFFTDLVNLILLKSLVKEDRHTDLLLERPDHEIDIHKD